VTTILLAEDHHVVRQAFKVLLEEDPDWLVVGEAANGPETVALAEQLHPDILLVDLMMPGINGLEVTRQVSRLSPETRVVVLSMHSDEAYVLEALRNGAVGYVLKGSTAMELIQALREVREGRRYLSPPLSERALDDYVKKARDTNADLYETLTTRERELLHLVAEGNSSSEISGRMSISQRTVETHRTNVNQKLGLRTQADLIRYALRRGILPLED